MIIREGTYRGVLDGAGALAFATSGNKGTENVQLRMRFTKGPPEVVGQCRTWFGYMTDGAWQRTVEVLRYLYPWTTDELADLVAIAADHPEALEVELVIENEVAKDRDGRVKRDEHGREVVVDKLAWVNIPRTFGTPMDDQALREFSNRWRTSVATVKSPQRTPGAPAQPATASPGNGQRAPGGGARSGPNFGDDIPPPDDRDAPPPRGGTPFGGR